MKNIKINSVLSKKGTGNSSFSGMFGRIKPWMDNLINPRKTGQQQQVKEKTTQTLKQSKQPVNPLTILSDLFSKQVVTLDINDKSIRLLEARGDTIKRWASTPYKSEDAEKGSNRSDALGTIVKRLMNKSGIKTNKVILSVNGLNSVNRILQSTTASVELMNQDAISTLVNEEMNLTAAQLYLSWKVIRPMGGVWEIYIMGILRDELDEQIRSLKKEGINPHILESKAVTLSRLANKKHALILNIEPSSYDVIVVSSFIPTISHTTSWQADLISDEDKAEQLLLALGMALDFNNSHYPESTIDAPVPLVIMGQLSADTGLMAKLKDMSDYNIESIAPSIKYPADFPLSEYITNVGLVLRDSEPANSLFGLNLGLNIGFNKRKTDGSQDYDTYASLATNLLPKAYHPWRPSPMQVFSVAAVIIAVVMLIPYLGVVSDSMSKTSSLQLQYQNLNNVLERRKQEIKSREPLAAVVSEYNTITGSAGYFNDDLNIIRDTAATLNVQLLSVNHGGKNITVNCTADNNTLRQFDTALQESGQFVKVTLPEKFWVYPLPDTVEIKLESKMGK